MAIRKKFRVLIVDGNNNVIRSLGTHYMNILVGNATYYSGYKNPSSEGTAPWVGHVDAPDLVGAVQMITSWFGGDAATYMSQLTIMGPCNEFVDLTPYAGYYIKCIGSNGFYCKSHGPIQSDGQCGVEYDYYDDQGMLKLSQGSISSGCMPPFVGTYYNGKTNLVVSSINADGTIDDYRTTSFYTADCYVANTELFAYTISGASFENSWSTAYTEWLNGVDNTTDFSPYANGGINKGKKGGESGKWVNPQPPTPVPSLPSNTILEAGLLNCYKVTFSDLERIASFMFDPSVTNELMKVGTTLFDYMDGMYQVPVAVSTGANEVMALGNVFSGGGAIASSVSLPTVTEQYYEIDCGTVEVEEYWGNALDYSPYTKVTIMLPYIGAKELSADEVVGKTLHLKYHIDILSGACVAFLYESLTGGEQAVLYEFSGNCIMQLPLRQTDHAELIKGVLDTALAASAGAAVVGHGVAAVEAAGTAKQTAAAHITAEKQFASTESSAVTGIASNVTGAKVNVQRTGNLAGAQGFLGIQKPYLIIQRPTQAYPENMGHYKGFPCNQEARLGDLSGFTVVDSIRLNGLVGTEPEIAEIYDLLSKGVII